VRKGIDLLKKPVSFKKFLQNIFPDAGD